MPIYLPPISRRRFLAGSVATAAGLLLADRLLAAHIPIDPHRFALLSDVHSRVQVMRFRAQLGALPSCQFLILPCLVMKPRTSIGVPFQ